MRRRCDSWMPLSLLVITCAALAAAGDPPAAPESSDAPRSSKDGAAAKPALPTMSDTKPRDLPGLHNAVAYADGFISGGAPEGEIAFETLAALGVRTIISVDGAVPDVELAKKHGLTYVHLPIGYNGFDEKRKLELVRATRDSIRSGPVYLHCHHGKHRSAGAAGAVAVSLGMGTPEQMLARMKVSGTAPNYKGLYACTAESKPIDAKTIDAVPATMPEISKPNSYVKGMVEMDEVFDHLKAIEKAQWKTPTDHPDLVPAAEAGRMAELFRHLKNGEYAQRKPEEFRAMMQSSHEQAQLIEDQLVSATPDAAKLAAAFKSLGTSCKDCHAKYRD